MCKYLLIAFGAFAIIAGCGSKMSPREVAIEFVGSVIEDDSLAIEKYLDLDYMVERRLTEVPPEDSTMDHRYYRDKILQTLIGDGGTRAFWKSMMPVVNKENIQGDTAEVELTFMDKTYGKTHYSMIYLYRSEDGWRVFYFL
jgi:hypothetical protein